MPEWGLLIIQLFIIAGVGLFFWKNPFICAAGTLGFSIWLVFLSFANYGDLTWGAYLIIMVRRFTCIFGIVSFAIEEVYRFQSDDGSLFTITFVPSTFIDAAWKAAVSAAGCILITDFIVPLIVGDGFFSTFRYAGVLGIVFLVPSLALVGIEIYKFIRRFI